MFLPLLLMLRLAGSTLPQVQRVPDVVEDVVVTAPSPAAVAAFVGGLTDPGRRGANRGQIARWGEPICLRVIGGAYADNERLGAAVEAVFISLDIPVDRPTCRPNAIVVVADDADGFARAFSDRYRSRFFQNQRQSQSEFMTVSGPVRWEHRTRVGAAGRSPRIDAWVTRNSPGQVVSGLDGAIELPDSRITQSTAERIERSMVVLDARQITAMPLDNLAAYVAFVTLVDMPMDAHWAGRNTILNLFDPARSVPGGLTPWDRAFIESLYAIRTDLLFAMQRQELEQRMAQALNARAPNAGN